MAVPNVPDLARSTPQDAAETARASSIDQVWSQMSRARVIVLTQS